MSAIEFLKSDKTRWTARNNEYTISLEDGLYTVRDGHGGFVADAKTLKAAKTAAQNHQDSLYPR